jgi:hypothetical protein
MPRVLTFVIAYTLLVGCQTQNPYAAFGPPTIPAPNTTETPPYYPPSGAAAGAGPKAAVASTRPFVSASGPSIPAARPTFLADPTDREPIRIVEDNDAAARTAAASRVKAAAPRHPTPVIQPPRGAPTPLPPRTGFTPSGKSLRDPAVAPAAFVEAPATAGQWRAR